MLIFEHLDHSCLNQYFIFELFSLNTVIPNILFNVFVVKQLIVFILISFVFVLVL